MNERTTRVRKVRVGAAAAWAFLLIGAPPVLAAQGPTEAVEHLRAQIPAIDRIDAATDYVRRTAQGEKTGYIVLFKTGSIADPTAKGRAERAARLKSALADEMPVESAKVKVLAEAGVRSADAKERYSQLPLSYVELSSAAELNNLLAHSEVESLEANRVFRAMQVVPSNLDLIKWPSVQAFGNLGAGASVAVLDTGVCYKRTASGSGYCENVNEMSIQSAFGNCDTLGNGNCKVALARDFASDDNQLDDTGHGTNVAAIASAVAPSAKILALDVFNGNFAQLNDILEAMNFVIDTQRTQPGLYNIVAMNLSLGGTLINEYSSMPLSQGAYKVAVDSALQYGVATIVAAGNESSQGGLNRPANTAGVISVGSVYNDDTTRDTSDNCYMGIAPKDKPVCVSNFASYLTILGPGKPVTAAGLTASGTSQAAPHVAGAYAALRAAFPSESHAQILGRMTGAANSVAVTDSRSYAANKVFPRLDLWRAFGSCDLLPAPPPINLLNDAGSRSFSFRTTSAHCPVAVSVGTHVPPWLTNVSATQDPVDRTLWRVNYAVDSNAGVMPRSVQLNFNIAAQAVPVGVMVTQSNIAGNQTISVSPASVGFGQYEASGIPSAPANVEVSNTAGATNPLVVSNICIATSIGSSCESCGGFSATSACSGLDIAPNGTCPIAVRFNPPGSMPYQCHLRIDSNAASSPTFVPLNGQGLGVDGGKPNGGFGVSGVDSMTTQTNDVLADIVTLPDGNFLAAGKNNTAILITQHKGDSALPALSFVRNAVTPGVATGSYAAVAVRRTADGKAVVMGNFSASGGVKKGFVARFHLNGGSAGNLDSTFNSPNGAIVDSFGIGTGTDAVLQAASIGAPNDSIYLKINCNLVRLSAIGAIDGNYGPGGKVALVNCNPEEPGNIVVLPTGEVLYATSSGTTEKGIGIGRVTAGGLVDTAFGKNGVANGRALAGAQRGFASAIAVLANGGIVAVGPIWPVFANSGSPFAAYAVKFAPNGAIDTTFGIDGAIELAARTVLPRFYPGAVRVLDTGQFAVLRKQTPAGIDETGPNGFSMQFRKADGALDGSFIGSTNNGTGSLTSALGSGASLATGDDGGPVVAYDNGAGGGVARFTPPLLSGSSAEGVVVRVTGAQSSANQTVNFVNNQGAPLSGMNSLGAYSVSNGDFTITGTTCPLSLSVGGNCDISISVVRGVIGVRAATLTINASAPGGPATFQITIQAMVTAATTNRLAVVKSGTGSGRVRSMPSGIDCGPSCQVLVDAGMGSNQTLTLTATPDANSTFSGWSGACGGTGNCVVTVSQQRDVTATFAIKPSSIPANDTFASPRPLGGSLVTDPPCAAIPAPARAANCGLISRIANIGAAKEAGEPMHAGNAGGHSLWWRWTAPSTGPVTIDTKGSTFDTTLAVYVGSNVNALTTVDSNDDDAYFRSKVTFNAQRGQVYQIAVDGYNGVAGDVVLNLHQPIYMFMTGHNANQVYALDTVKNEFTASNISNPYVMDGNVTINSAGDRLYVTNYFNDTVSVINSKTGQKVSGSPFATGSRPEGVAINPLDNRFYVVNYAGNSVSVFDAVSNAKITDVDVGAGTLPSQAAVHPSGKTVYVTFNNAGQVGVIDAAQNKLVARINVGQNPYNLVFDPVRPLLYVANNATNTISVIDTTNNTTVDEIRPRNGQSNDFNSLQGLAVNPEGTRLFTGNVLTATISVVDLATRAIVKTVAVGEQAQGIAVSLDGKTLYTTNRNSNSVHIFRVSDIEDNAKCSDGGSCAPMETKNGVAGAWATNGFLYSGGLAIPGYPLNDSFAERRVIGGGFDITVTDNSLANKEIDEGNHDDNAGGHSLWWSWTAPVNGRVTVDTFGSGVNTVVGAYSGSNISGLTPAPNIGRTTIDTSGIFAGKLTFDAQAGQTYQIAVDGKDNAQGRIVMSVWQPVPAYLTSQPDKTVTTIDTVTNTVLAVRPSGTPPSSLDGLNPQSGVVSPDGSRIYVANYLSGTVAVMDRESAVPLALISVGGNPLGIAVNPAGTRVLVGDYEGTTVKLIDTTTNSVIQAITVGTSPAGIVFLPNGSKAYVANRGSTTVSATVSVIDMSNLLSAPATITGIGDGSYGIATNPTGSYVAVANLLNSSGTGGLTIIDTASNSTSAQKTQSGPVGVAVSPTGSHLLVTNSNSGTVSVFTGSPVQPAGPMNQPLHVPVGAYPTGVAFTPDGKYAYIGNYTGNTLSVMRMSDYKIVGTYGGVNGATSFGNFIYQQQGLSSAPAAPVISAIVPGSGQLTVNFTAGANNGSPIGSFTAVAVAQDNSRYLGSCVFPCTSIVIAGLTNGSVYSVTMIATNGIGNSPDSASVSGTPGGSGGLTLSSVVSRKTHGAAGDFNVSIDPMKPLSGLIDVEPRNIGTAHRIIFTFSQPVSSIGTVTALDAMNMSVGSISSGFSGNMVTVLMTNVPNGKRVTITIPNVNGTGNGSASLGFLVGDVNSTGIVTAADIAGIKARSGQDTVLTNARYDINLSGKIDSTDVSSVKSRAGNRLP